MGPEPLCMLGIWVSALIYDVSSAWQHSLPYTVLMACVCSAYGPSSLMGLGPYLGCFDCLSVLTASYWPYCLCMLRIWALKPVYMLVIWVLALIYDAASACQHSLPRVDLAVSVCSAYGPSSPLHAWHMGPGPYLCF